MSDAAHNLAAAAQEVLDRVDSYMDLTKDSEETKELRKALDAYYAECKKQWWDLMAMKIASSIEIK